MTKQGGVTPRQFTAAAFVSALSLLIRRFPRVLAAQVGRSAALAVPCSVLPLALGLVLARLLFRRREDAGGVPGLFSALLGPAAGRALTGLYGFWFVLYAGFLLRSGSERILTTVYTGAGPAVFVCVMALICAVAAAGRLLPLCRAAMLFRPLMLALIGLVAVLTAKDLDLTLLLPLRPAQPAALGLAALEIANLLSIGFFLGFAGAQLTRPLRARDYLPWLGVLLGVIALMTVGCLGMFGPELTAKLSYPYFMLVRDLTVLGALERLEPVAVALWVCSDFILISLLLHLAAGSLRFALGLRAGRWTAPVCAVCAAIIALALPGGMDARQALSERIVPLLCAGLAFGPLPPLLLARALRSRRI